MKHALLMLLLAACDPIDVVVRVPDGGDLPPLHPCLDNTDCHENEYCQKHDCNDAHGGCLLRPQLCTGMDFAPVCGCNGVTYWNDCLRQADGASAVLTAGECTSAKTCSSASECSASPSAACSRVAAITCPSSGSVGACWVMPAQCPSGLSTTWQACSGGACMDLCGAIKSEQPALQKPSCP